MSKLVYLMIVWGGAQQYLLNILQVQQLDAARTVCGFFSRGWDGSLSDSLYFSTLCSKPTRPSYLESQEVFMSQFPNNTHTEQGMLHLVELDMGKCSEGSPVWLKQALSIGLFIGIMKYQQIYTGEVWEQLSTSSGNGSRRMCQLTGASSLLSCNALRNLLPPPILLALY